MDTHTCGAAEKIEGSKTEMKGKSCKKKWQGNEKKPYRETKRSKKRNERKIKRKLNQKIITWIPRKKNI